MKHKIFGISVILLIGCLISSCNKNQFQVSGVIKGGENCILYLEKSEINRNVVLDSVKVKKDGSYRFKGKGAEGVPEFYRLRLDNRFIDFAIDSSEAIVISADSISFDRNYTVENSYTSEQMLKVRQWHYSCMESIASIARNTSLPANEKMLQTQLEVEVYKENTKKLIYGDPRSAASYYALFQTLFDYGFIFNFFDPQDMKALGAVATSWNTFYPQNERSKHLYNMTMEAMSARKKGDSMLEVSSDVVQTVGYLDISLADGTNRIRKISDLQQKVVLLDFISYAAESSPSRVLKFREWYSIYKSKGLEIYQISVDPDIHFWKLSTESLPWICVQDPESIYSKNLKLYNVEELPTGFLINKDGDLIGRYTTLSQIEEALKTLCK